MRDAAVAALMILLKAMNTKQQRARRPTAAERQFKELIKGYAPLMTASREKFQGNATYPCKIQRSL
jgi:hypothetical protein